MCHISSILPKGPKEIKGMTRVVVPLERELHISLIYEICPLWWGWWSFLDFFIFVNAVEAKAKAKGDLGDFYIFKGLFPSFSWQKYSHCKKLVFIRRAIVARWLACSSTNAFFGKTLGFIERTYSFFGHLNVCFSCGTPSLQRSAAVGNGERGNSIKGSFGHVFVSSLWAEEISLRRVVDQEFQRTTKRELELRTALKSTTTLFGQLMIVVIDLGKRALSSWHGYERKEKIWLY